MGRSFQEADGEDHWLSFQQSFCIIIISCGRKAIRRLVKAAAAARRRCRRGVRKKIMRLACGVIKVDGTIIQ